MSTGKILQTKTVHKNPYFQVRKDIVFYQGKKNNWYSVDKSPFVIIIPLSNKNKIYLVGQWRYCVKKYSWEIPKGTIDKNEKPLQAAKRELEEETGLRAKKWKLLGSFYVGPGCFNQLCYVFLAKDLVKQERKPPELEELKVKEVSLKEINQLIKKNKIFDGPTIGSLYKLGLDKKYGKNF